MTARAVLDCARRSLYPAPSAVPAEPAPTAAAIDQVRARTTAADLRSVSFRAAARTSTLVSDRVAAAVSRPA